MVDLRDETVLLKDRDELAGCDETELRTVPADQRLSAAKRLRLRIIFGLIIYHKLFVLDGLLLVLVHLVHPHSLLHELLVKEGDARVVAARKRCTRRAGVVIFLLQVEVLSADDAPRSVLLHGQQIHAEMERKLVRAVDIFEVFDHGA